MNLWVFNHYAVPPRLPGGTRHFDFSRQLVRQGWEVTVFASGYHHWSGTFDRTSPREPLVVEMVEGVRFVWLRTRAYRGNGARRLLGMFDYARQALRATRTDAGLNLKAPDIILGCSVHPLAAWTGARAARRMHARFFLELRDLWPQSLIDMGVLSPHHPAAWLLRRLEKWLLQRAEGTIVLSPRTRDYLLSRGTPSYRIHLIPNGIDLSNLPAQQMPVGERHPFTVLYAGAHGVANRLDVVLEAARLLSDDPDVRFVFVGDGPEKARLLERKAEYRLDNVEFRDAVPKSNVPAVLAEADALVLSEAQNVYGSSNKLFDYLAASRPLILSTHSPHNLASEARCGLEITPNDPQALADAVLELRGMKVESRAEMGKRARAYVEANHSWRILAEKLVEVFRSE